MRVAVIGAGIIGVTTAYELAADGHAVTVFERRGSVAEEASFANAGVVAPGYVTPWAGPGMRTKVLRQLLARHAAVRVRWPLSVAELDWMAKWSAACDPDAFAANRRRMQRLAIYSRQRLHHLTEHLGLVYDRANGYTVLLRSEQEQRQMQPSLNVLRELGAGFQELDEAATRLVEPGLNPDTRFLGSIHLPQDEVGNCRQFAQLLRDEAQKRGVEFELKTHVACVAIDAGGGFTLSHQSTAANDSPPSTLVSTMVANPPADSQAPLQTQSFDHVVVCAGAASADLLKPLGVSISLARIWGYSVSAQVREPLNAPRSAVMDERFKVAISRLGQRVRVAGGAEVGGTPHHVHAGAVATLYKVLNDWFPGAANLRHVQTWKGARPMLPDGPPLIGKTHIPKLWLNLGHGSSGWALACGSARVLADTLAGQPTAIDTEGLGLERLGGA